MKSLLLFSCLLLTPVVIYAQAKPLAQDYRIVFHNPDRERYVEGPGLVRLDDGTLVAVVPVVPRELAVAALVVELLPPLVVAAALGQPQRGAQPLLDDGEVELAGQVQLGALHKHLILKGLRRIIHGCRRP